MPVKVNNNDVSITMDRMILILALIGVIALSAVIGFIMGIVASPLDFNDNIPPSTAVVGK